MSLEHFESIPVSERGGALDKGFMNLHGRYFESPRASERVRRRTIEAGDLQITKPEESTEQAPNYAEWV